MFYHARRTLIAAMLAASAPVAHAGGVCYVDDDAAPGGDGLGWDTAYRFLADALAASQAGEVRVAAGVYTADRTEAVPAGTGNRTLSFELVDGVEILGGFAGVAGGDPDDRDHAMYETVLDGDLAGDDDPDDTATLSDNSYHVVRAVGVDATAVLDGFTIRGGSAGGVGLDNRGAGAYVDGSPVFAACRFRDNDAWGNFANGGGMYIAGGAPSLSGCTFTGNTAGAEGAGLYNAPPANPTVVACIFESNAAGGRGGGMRNLLSDPLVINCSFTGNVAVEGGGMHNTGVSSPTVVGCTFTGNTATIRGGGMFNRNGASPAVTGCTFTANSTTGEGGGMYNVAVSNPVVTACTFTDNDASSGGAITNLASTPVLVRCTFNGNTADRGGAVCNLDSSPSITGCSFSDNTAVGGGRGGGLYNEVSSPVVSGCTFIANTAGEGAGMASELSSSPVLIGCAFILNTSTAAGGGTYFRNGGVPVISDCTFSDNAAAGGGGGMATTQSSVPAVSDSVLCSNSPTQIDGEWTDDGGNAINGTCDPTCPGDLTGDGAVDIADMLVVLAQWGPCPAACPGDADADGGVGITDLLAVLGAWGVCPQSPGKIGPAASNGRTYSHDRRTALRPDARRNPGPRTRPRSRGG